MPLPWMLGSLGFTVVAALLLLPPLRRLHAARRGVHRRLRKVSPLDWALLVALLPPAAPRPAGGGTSRRLTASSGTVKLVVDIEQFSNLDRRARA
jgi:hypothetical protein